MIELFYLDRGKTLCLFLAEAQSSQRLNVYCV
ncbi:MAG: hypothetical protein JWP12_939 [Bacteroidetes bacterium]|nr:hypothetical protein [Bacteroidota bacterium]